MISSGTIATQGLMPLGTALVIGVQGLLAGAAPQPPIAPTAQHGLWSQQWRDKERVSIEVRGTTARVSIGQPLVSISSIQIASLAAKFNSTELSFRASTSFIARGAVQNLASNRALVSLSSSIDVVGCEEENIPKLLSGAHAAIENAIMREIIESYDD